MGSGAGRGSQARSCRPTTSATPKLTILSGACEASGLSYPPVTSTTRCSRMVRQPRATSEPCSSSAKPANRPLVLRAGGASGVGRVGNMADEQRGLGGTVHDGECKGMVGADGRYHRGESADLGQGDARHWSGLSCLLV